MVSVDNWRILVCDDSLTNAIMLSKLVENDMDNVISEHLTDPRQVLSALKEEHYDLLLLDLEMPEMNGVEVLRQVRSHWAVDQLPVIVITGSHDMETQIICLAEGANDFIGKPINPVEVCLRIKTTLAIRKAHREVILSNQQLEEKVEQRTAQLNRTMEYLVYCLGSVGEFRDSETGKHVVRVGKYSRLLAQASGLPDDLAFMIEKAAPLHDIGKVGIPDEILLKPGRLDADEWEMMQKHVLYGYKILEGSHSQVIRIAQSIAGAHHERWDGKGYPRKLKGESIPIEGRITAIADVFDALTSTRPYKSAWTFKDAMKYLKGEAGGAFDPNLVALFLQNTDQVHEIYSRYSG